MKKLLPEDTARFVNTQIQLCKRKPKGRRYTKEFKQYCLNLYFTGPKLYRYLAKRFCLPSVSALLRLTIRAHFSCGIHDYVFELLKIKIDSLKDMDKYCILCIDEMSLKACVNYNAKNDEVLGIEDINNIKHMKPACSAIVIMLRSINGNWTQPIGYNFTSSSGASAHQIEDMIFCCLRKSNINGLKIMAIISDMGSCFVEFTNLHGISKAKPYFEFEEQRYYYIFDVPHLIKATRNHLKESQFYFDGRYTSWLYIKHLYEISLTTSNRPAPKLSPNHIWPNNFCKMKVKYATQLISMIVASGIELLIKQGLLDEEGLVTSNFIRKFDNLFDMLNSSIHTTKS